MSTRGRATRQKHHLDPQKQSDLPGILAAVTPMRVIKVTAKEKLQAEHVYVIPPDRRLCLIVDGGDFRSGVRRTARPPSADRLFFRSLASIAGTALRSS